jgi:gamma-glutamyltranspeptidase/glutathione hydrolase
VVAAGHPEVCGAAVEVLQNGGNAFDAVVAAGFAGAVAEPLLTGLGGGGFLLAGTAAGERVLFDFFVDTPGLGLGRAAPEPAFHEVVVHFPASDQAFNVGTGSVAVPGCLAGYLHVHDRLGRLALTEVIGPAARLATEGVVLTEMQAYLVELLWPILERSEGGRRIYAPEGHPGRVGEHLVNADLADFLGRLADDPEATFYRGPMAEQIATDMAADGGLVTTEDLARYGVVEREPLVVDYRGRQVLTNPPPSFGGSLIALGLSLLEAAGPVPARDTPEHAVTLVESMIQTDRQRGASKGTTHVSVADREGNVASMTTSNGEGSGYVVPETGVMLNNMLGEDDLHPDGFHAAPPGQRVASMMSPTLVEEGGEVRLVVGSGGSKRIRTTLVQVISAVVDHGLVVTDAIEAPRLHWDGEVVQAEPGWSADALAALAARWPVNEWSERNLYFGGAHAVVPGTIGAGDPRRGGAWREVV